MNICGKCRPEKDRFNFIMDQGFENVELYLKKEHLDKMEETVKACEETQINIESVHTPHIQKTEKEYLHLTSQLASKIDAGVVVHSSHIRTRDMIDFEVDYNNPYGFENQWGDSVFYMENHILRNGIPMTIDICHLYISEGEYLTKFERLVQKYTDIIPFIHIADSTLSEDGLKFGRGNLDLEQAVRILDDHYDGTITIETQHPYQGESLDKFLSYV